MTSKKIVMTNEAIVNIYHVNSTYKIFNASKLGQVQTSGRSWLHKDITLGTLYQAQSKATARVSQSSSRFCAAN